MDKKRKMTAAESDTDAAVEVQKKKRRWHVALGDMLRSQIDSERAVPRGALRLFADLSAVAIGFLFAGCHLIFGSYPLAIALVAVLPQSVWLALLGAVIGSLVLGRVGVIYGMICILVVFLRVVISGGDKHNASDGTASGNTLFSENVALRMSSATIGGFVAAVYEILLEGISFATVMFGACMIIIPAVLVFGFSGLFEAGIGVRDLLVGGRSIFICREGSKREKFELVMFRIAAALFIVFISLSLMKYVVFGINVSLIFAAAVTLFCAKRFGVLYALSCGFLSSFTVSGIQAVAFALLGVGAGALFSFGHWYAILGGGALLSAWGAYSGGVSGFLSVFPEYVLGSVILIPLYKFIEREESPEEEDTVTRQATDMVGTMALAFRNEKRCDMERLETALSTLAPRVNSYTEASSGADAMSFALLAKMMNEARLSYEREREMDEELGEGLSAVFSECGFPGGVIRAFGDRRKHFIMAGEDSDGLRITAPELKTKIEGVAGVKLGTPEYFRRGNMVLMECEAASRYKILSGYAAAPSDSGEVTGGSMRVFSSEDNCSYAIICDGMGTGEVAGRTSAFVCELLSALLGAGASVGTMLHLANTLIRSGASAEGAEECSTTVDLFEIDTVSGEAVFTKCGAAPSYIKRKGSLFRIKSETMPLGLLKSVDAERIRAEVGDGDYIIMMSDGISRPDAEDTPWLVELLNKPFSGEVSAFAELILKEAIRNSDRRDDMSVAVLKVIAL